ncbi:MAG: oligoribonuclease [Actinomycetia bacterium]|nr:oligoribonuclease [Actinomycetes bacterium]
MTESPQGPQSSASGAAATPEAPSAPKTGQPGKTTRIVWIDCEMTGLDFKQDTLVEIACVVTESDLTPVDDGVSVVIKPADAPFEAMDEFVVNMHKNSGLLNEIPHGTTLAAAQKEILDYIKGHVPESGKAPLAGSSVYVDRIFLAREMPELDEYLHYRLIDVSSLKELAKRWYPKAYYSAPEKTGNHRALGDILDSIAELDYYRSAILIPPPQ